MDSALGAKTCRWRTGYCRSVLASLAYLSWILCYCACVWAGPLENEVDFHISAGLLADALLEFSTQANVQIAVAPHATANLHTPGLNGHLSVSLALEKLLRNSGLAYQTVGETVTIVPSASGPRVSERSAETATLLTQPR